MCLAVSGEILTISDGQPRPAVRLPGSSLSAPPPPASSPAAAPAPDSPLPDSPLSATALDPLWRVAEVDFGGVRQQVSLACLPEARVGDRVLVHVGFALSLVEEEEEEWQSVELPDPAAGGRGC